MRLMSVNMDTGEATEVEVPTLEYLRVESDKGDVWFGLDLREEDTFEITCNVVRGFLRYLSVSPVSGNVIRIGAKQQ